MATGWRGQYIRYRGFFLNIVDLYKKRADLRAFLEVILSISTVTIFLLFALKPTMLTIVSLVKEIKEKQTTLAKLNQKISDLETAINIYSQNQNFIPNIDLSVPTKAAPDVVAKQVQALAAKDSVSILGISVSQVALVGSLPTKKGSSEIKPLPTGAKEMPFSISVKGDYAALTTFIKDLENLRVVTKIDTLLINSSNTETGRVIVAVISGRAPFLGD